MNILKLVLFSLVNLTCAQIYPFVKQYHECETLKMIRSTDEYGFVSYSPDPKLPNNSLPDSFYARAGYDTMSLDESMKLFKTIFDRLPRNCTTEMCKCVRQAATSAEYYSIFFDSDENAYAMALVISALDATLRADRVSFEEYAQSYLDLKNYPALSRFAYNNEFTSFRASQYNKYYICTGQSYSNVKLFKHLDF